ncbi:MAG: flagellar hook-associated protein 3 [bacterium]|nr:flagellar hook-associated protein 3 [bacterium]
MRITNSMIYRFGVRNAQDARGLLTDIQQKASTGKRINTPSDDPVKVRAVTLIRDGLAEIDQYRRNINTSRLRVSTTESALNRAYDVMSQVQVKAIEGRSTTSAGTRNLLAEGIAQLHGQLLGEANSRDAGGGRVFAGFATDTDPFVASGAFASGAAAPTVSFVGDTNEIRVDIDDGIDMRVTLQGDRVFTGAGGGEDLFQLVEDLWTALDTDDEILMGNVIDRTETAMDQVSAELTAIGSSDAQAELWEQRHLDRNAMLREQLSLLEDVDSIEVFSQLVQQEAALQGSIEVTSRILQTNLLSFL